ncbi:MAG: LruC domain-containing protein [Bacteroidota bacterium]
MKKLVAKTGMLLIIGLSFSIHSKAQLTLNCESGNISTEINACWGFLGVSYVNTAQVISGNLSTQSSQLTNPAPDASWIKTPWMKLGTGNISLKARLSEVSGTNRGIIFSYIAYDSLHPPYYESTAVVFDSSTWNSINTDIKTLTSAIPLLLANSNQIYKIRISFVGTGGNSSIIADNFQIPGNYWSNPAENCMPLASLQDADNDGVEDSQDAFPNDPYKAYKSYFPIENHFSTLAFEDLWPAKGDYDFNDVVVDYNSLIVTNPENQVVEINYQFKVRATGASFRNGFGFELININPNAIRSVTGSNIKIGSVYSIASNGTENGQANACIIAIGNVYDVLAYPGGSVGGINTTIGAPYATPQIVNVKLSFIVNGVPGTAGPINISQLGSNTFNPFIIVNQIRGKEVHLSDYKPTTLANLSLFGTLQDDSNLGIGRYYRTKTNLPWAIRTYESFQYPIEKADVTSAYLKLIDWVISNGTLFYDWDTNPNYRDNTFIYSHP